eukprot:249146-Ditylum_brightwellii.AAC.1
MAVSNDTAFNAHSNVRLEALLEAGMMRFKTTWVWLVHRPTSPMLPAAFQEYLLVRMVREREVFM